MRIGVFLDFKLLTCLCPTVSHFVRKDVFLASGSFNGEQCFEGIDVIEKHFVLASIACLLEIHEIS